MEAYLLAANGEAGLGFGGMVLTTTVMMVILYFVMVRPQKKREKQAQEMRSKLEVGDEIVTIGGIIGTVISLRDETLVIETGSDRSKVRIARWSIQVNNTERERADAEKK